MSLTWVHENPPQWDRSKQEIVGQAAPGIFALDPPADGELVPGEWWRVEDHGRVVGFGWMECTWGDAEILLAVEATRRGHGVGTFILDRLEEEAAARGLNYMHNVVQPTHPDPEGVTRWLRARRFEEAHDRLRRQVRNAGPTD